MDEIRFTGDLQRLRPEPGDVYVLTTQQRISSDMAARLRSHLSIELNGAKVLVLGDGLTLSVAKESECPSSD